MTTPLQKMIARGFIFLPRDDPQKASIDWAGFVVSALIFGFIGFIFGALVISITGAR